MALQSLVAPDESGVRKVESRVDVDSQLIQSVVDRLVDAYCGPLDRFMAGVKPVLEDTQRPITDDELEAAMLKITSLRYFTGDAMENLGIKMDIAESVRKEVYNAARDAAVGTVADKNSIAEVKSVDETLVKAAYERAYRKIKLKLELSSDVYSALKRVMDKRMKELMRLGESRGSGDSL